MALVSPGAVRLEWASALVQRSQSSFNARLIFADPAMRSLYADWETTARMTVGHLRMEAARNAGSPQLTGLVNELSELDADFRRWWAEHHVMARTAGTKTLNHPVVGALVLEWESLTCSTDSDQELIVWTAEPGTPSHERLSLLASLAADGRESAPAQPGAGQEQASARSV